MSDDPRPIEPPTTRPSLRSGGGTDSPQTEGKRFDVFLHRHRVEPLGVESGA
jgi:hypothetical protein